VEEEKHVKILFGSMVWNSISRLADAVINDVRGGLRGYH